jgi:predicted GNAT family acetyltransferase
MTDDLLEPGQMRAYLCLMDADVTDNVGKSRFELVVDGHVAFADYRIEGGRMLFPHTEVPEALEGRGVGTRLVKAALADARARGLEPVGQCSFVAAVMKREARRGN